jgi:selenocysteine lyase/cysteine desulfurase
VNYRDQFDLPDGIYLLAHSAGALPHSVRAANQQFMDEWADGGADSWPNWLEHVEDYKRALARLFNAQPAEFCPQLNLSAGLSKFVDALPKRARRTKLVCSELDFPTIGFVLQGKQAFGYEVELIPAGDGTVSVERWLEHLTPDVQLAHVTYSTSENSYCPDITAIMRAAHERGIYVVIDVAQSAGVMPIDFASWDCVAVIGSCLKWLCGGPGAGFLWVRNDLARELVPTDVGWWSHANPFEFDIRHFEFAPDARRFMGGTTSPLPFLMAAEGINVITSIGVERIREHNLLLLSKLRSAALDLGLTVNTHPDPARHGGTLVLDFRDRVAAQAELTERSIRVDVRPRYGLRFSPHIYNSLMEIEYVIEALRHCA